MAIATVDPEESFGACHTSGWDASSGVAQLSAILSQLSAWFDSSAIVSDAEPVDRIALLERIKAAAAAAQISEIVQFATSQAASQQSADVHPKALGRGIADQVALACKISPTAGSQRLSLARALWFDLPNTLSSLRRGEVSEWVATLVSRETSHLDAQARRHVDKQLADCDMDAWGLGGRP